jgi:VIT1/CCC1 family predicted Fe2+/Mn2+ transporter
MDDPQQPIEEAEALSLSEDLRLLVEQGKEFARAELDWQKARAKYAGQQAGIVAGVAALAAAFFLFALVALVVGAVIALAPVIGAWLATAAVAGTLAVVALMLALIAMLKARAMGRLIADKPAKP